MTDFTQATTGTTTLDGLGYSETVTTSDFNPRSNDSYGWRFALDPGIIARYSNEILEIHGISIEIGEKILDGRSDVIEYVRNESLTSESVNVVINSRTLESAQQTMEWVSKLIMGERVSNTTTDIVDDLRKMKYDWKTPEGEKFPRYVPKIGGKDWAYSVRKLYETKTGKTMKENLRSKNEKIAIYNITNNKKYASFFENVEIGVKKMTSKQLKSFINI